MPTHVEEKGDELNWMLKKASHLFVVFVSFMICTLVVVGCWISDDEELPTNGSSHVSEPVPKEGPTPSNQVAHTSDAASAGQDAPTSQAAQASEAASDAEDAPNNQAVHSSEAASVHVSPRSKSPAPLRLKIFEASAIVRASLISSAAGAVRYSEALGLDLDGEPLTSYDVVFNKIGLGDSLTPVDGEYRAAHTYRFRVTEYLKGSGASEIAVTARTFSTRGTEAQALQVANESLAERDTSRDAHEAILFLWKPASDGASTDAFYFLRSGPYPPLQYTINTLNRVWLPAKEPPPGMGPPSTSDDSTLLFLTGDPSEPSPSTMSLEDLRSEIVAVDALIAAGDGTEGYSECIVESWRYEHANPEPRVPVYFTNKLASGTPEETVLNVFSYHGPRYSKILIQGVDKDLFKAVRVDDDDRPDNGYRIGDATARPLPAGMYRIESYIQDYTFIPCNFFPDNTYSVESVVVTPPEGTLHELFFDPVTLRQAQGRPSTVGADDATGVLKPTSFTAANGASATLSSISYETGAVKLGVTPHNALAGHVVDIIELDGTVSLSLDVADAEVDGANGTLSWSVASQPWEDGDLLMVRIREALP